MPKYLTEQEHEAVTMGVGPRAIRKVAVKKLYKLQSSLMNKPYVKAIDQLIPEASLFADTALKGRKSDDGYAAEHTRLFHQKMGELAVAAGLRN